MSYDNKLDELLSQIKDFTEDTFTYRGKITTNAKGEASFVIRVNTNDDPEIIEKKGDQIMKSLIKICVDNNIPIAGRKP